MTALYVPIQNQGIEAGLMYPKFERQVEHRGLQKGLQQDLQQGLQQGLTQGKTITAKVLPNLENLK